MFLYKYNIDAFILLIFLLRSVTIAPPSSKHVSCSIFSLLLSLSTLSSFAMNASSLADAIFLDGGVSN